MDDVVVFLAFLSYCSGRECGYVPSGDCSCSVWVFFLRIGWLMRWAWIEDAMRCGTFLPLSLSLPAPLPHC